MTVPHAIRVLLVEDEPSIVDDYRQILNPEDARQERGLFATLERELFGSAVSHRRFPELELTVRSQGVDAVEAVRRALKDERPFAVAFIDLNLAPGLDGLQTAERIRTLDPEIYIALVAAQSSLHPVDLSERVPPADQLYFVKRPFHPVEIQQLVLGLVARWRGERWQQGTGRHGRTALAQGRPGLADVLQRLPSGALVFDRRDRLLSANERMAELFPELAELFTAGTPYEEIQREMVERSLPENTLVRIESWIGDRMDWHARSGGALEQRLRGGRWVLLVEQGAPSGETVCLYHDITDLKRREASRAIAAHMTQMAQAFAALCDNLEALGADGAPAAPQVAVLPAAAGRSSGGGHLPPLTAKLRAIAQRQKLLPEPTALNRLVADVVRRMRDELSRGLEIEVIAGAGLWPVLIDGGKFEGALAELLRNAGEAMSGGGRLTLETANIRLSREFVATRAGLQAGEYVRLSVQDTGPGMSADLVERAINPFFTSKEKGAHLGLGLSVAYGFIHQSGGYLEIDGGEGRGATVEIYFPRSEGRMAEPADDRPPEELPSGQRGRPADRRRA